MDRTLWVPVQPVTEEKGKLINMEKIPKEDYYDEIPHFRKTAETFRKVFRNGEQKRFIIEASNRYRAEQTALFGMNLLTALSIMDTKRAGGQEMDRDELAELNAELTKYMRVRGFGDEEEESTEDASAGDRNVVVIRIRKIYKKKEEEPEFVLTSDDVICQPDELKGFHEGGMLLVDEAGDEQIVRDIMERMDMRTLFLYREGGMSEYMCKILRFEYDFTRVSVPEPDISYYRKLLEYRVYEAREKIEESVDKDRLIHQLIGYRGELFTEKDIEKYVKKAVKNAEIRGHNRLEAEDFQLEEKGEYLSEEEELDQMIGLEQIKSQLNRMVSMYRFELKRKGRIPRIAKNIAFVGKPGSAKSTSAKLVAGLLGKYGVTNGRFLSVTKADMVGGHVGHTERKMKELFEKIQGGVLFIDEAGGLLTDDNFTKTAITELIRFMEEQPDTVVILATYPGEMDRLLSLDAGFQSRIAHIIHFPDYDNEELYQILELMCKKDDFILEECREEVFTYMDWMRSKKRESFANGREVRNVFLRSRQIMAQETCEKGDDPAHITVMKLSYIRAAIEELKEESCICRSEFRLGFLA